MKVKIINVLGDYRITTETGAFYPGRYATWGDAARKCEMNCFEIVKDTEETPASKADASKRSEPTNIDGMAAMLDKMNKIPEIKIYPGRVKFQVLQMFCDEQKKRFISTQEVAGILNISSAHVANLIDEGRLSAINIASKNSLRKVWRLLPESVYDFIISHFAMNPDEMGFANVPETALVNLRNRINLYLNTKER